MENVNLYLEGLLGEKSIVDWLLSFTFILIGVIVSLRLSAFKRDKDSPNTPIEFSLRFLFRDNLLRFIGSLFVAFSAVRFGEELFEIKVNYFICFLIGLSFDLLFEELAKWQEKGRDKFKN